MTNGCRVLAIEGTHCAGKTTLVQDLAAAYAAAGLRVSVVPDPARLSPLVAAVVADPTARFTLPIELDLLAATITAQLRAAEGQQLLVVDKTPANVLAYATLLLDRSELTDPLLPAMHALSRAWQPYDLVIRCTDAFPLDLTLDGYRAKVTQLQAAAAGAVHTALTDAGYPVLDLPPRLTPTERVTWLTTHPRLASLIPATH